MFEKNIVKVKVFSDLIVWQRGHRLVLEIYQITKEFPKDETFGLTSQIRRASVAFTSDLSEGFSRSSAKDKIRFYFMALGSLTEAQNQLFISKDLEYISIDKFNQLFKETIELHKMTNGLIKSTKNFLQLKP